MNKRYLNILLFATIFFWFVPLEGKKLWPSLFGVPAVQWPCAVLTAILSSLGLFLGLKALLSADRLAFRFFWPTACFLFVLTFNIFALGISYHAMVRHRGILDGLAAIDSAKVLIAKSISAEHDASERERFAQSAYVFFGATIAFRDESNELTQFSPTAEDVNQRNKSLEVHRQVQATRDFIDHQLAEIPYLIGTHLGSFVIILLGGMGYVAWSKSANNALDRTSG